MYQGWWCTTQLELLKVNVTIVTSVETTMISSTPGAFFVPGFSLHCLFLFLLTSYCCRCPAPIGYLPPSALPQTQLFKCPQHQPRLNCGPSRLRHSGQKYVSRQILCLDRSRSRSCLVCHCFIVNPVSSKWGRTMTFVSLWDSCIPGVCV